MKLPSRRMNPLNSAARRSVRPSATAGGERPTGTARQKRTGLLGIAEEQSSHAEAARDTVDAPEGEIQVGREDTVAEAATLLQSNEHTAKKSAHPHRIPERSV